MFYAQVPPETDFCCGISFPQFGIDLTSQYITIKPCSASSLTKGHHARIAGQHTNASSRNTSERPSGRRNRSHVNDRTPTNLGERRWRRHSNKGDGSTRDASRIRCLCNALAAFEQAVGGDFAGDSALFPQIWHSGNAAIAFERLSHHKLFHCRLALYTHRDKTSAAHLDRCEFDHQGVNS